MNFAEYRKLHEDVLEHPEESEQLDEALKKKFVIRNGKRTWKWTTTRKGKYRVQIDKKTGQPKEVFITNLERINRKKGQKKAAIKRKAKQKAISRLRRKAFRVRRNQGMHYNTASGRKKLTADEKQALKVAHSMLRPNMMRENLELLCESPWPEILPGCVWDFLAEKDPAWLVQLLTLYGEHYMESLDEKKNEYTRIELTEPELAIVTKNLLRDMAFIGFARADFNHLTPEEQAEFRRVVPGELVKAIAGQQP